jgi:prepilin-type processing-associated H-X9-DG protein
LKRLTSRRREGFGLCDLLVVAVLIPLIAVAMLSCQRHHGERADRIKCASNLRQIGQAIRLYADENGGAYPRTRLDLNLARTPTWATGAPATQPFAPDGPKPNDVTAAFFLLLRTQDITSEVFTCPTAAQEKWDFDGGTNTALNWSNWNGTQGIAAHLSYSYQNPYPTAEAVKLGWRLNTSISADYAVAADINPGTNTTGAGSSAKDVLHVTTASNSSELRGANSPNHSRDGQNVLYGDGHVSFEQNPFVSVQGDNLYTAKSGVIVDAPQDKDDSVLLPTIP